MADLFPNPDTGEQQNSLHTLLAAIDLETAQEVMLDSRLLKERAARNIRKKKPCITFLLGQDEMALPIDSVHEIGYLPPVTPLPNIPPWIRGIVQIRGEIMSVVDCSLLFGIREASHLLRPSYILFANKDLRFCLMADRITGVVNVDEQQSPLQPFSTEYGEHLLRLSSLFKGVYLVDKRKVYILDDDKMGSSSLIVTWQ
ncbi:MAG: chemotaxis protein CheW [Proteobacteria bacterium]|nr:chemotaxis protein CheW [Pseudomonadota bacterium]